MQMERIIEHIERLLLQHDCVIIPDFGGFVLQSVPAVYKGDEHAFLPAHKEIVFNPTLTHNDGLLMESYMQAYKVDFAKAQQLVRKDVAGMKQLLEDNSELPFGAVGLFMKEDERLLFMPEKNSEKQFSTQSYGLPAFHYLPLSVRQPMTAASMLTAATVSEAETPPPTRTEKTGITEKPEKQSKNIIYQIPVTRTFLQVAGAAAAAILLFFLISTPVGDVNKASYSASFVPQEIMPKKTADEVVSDAFSAVDGDATSGVNTENTDYLPEETAASASQGGAAATASVSQEATSTAGVTDRKSVV